MQLSPAAVILCVDDEPLLLKVRELVLRGQGYKVETAPDAFKAMTIFESRDIDLVVTDYILPGEDGIEMARKMKALKPDVPIILLSGSPELQEIADVIDDYLVKGTVVPVFLRHIEALIRRRARTA
jgi:DNA-binding response OmpR family regulator